jgi:hypothetical protein
VEYDVESGSGVMIYIPRFRNIGSGVQNLLVGISRQTHTKQNNLIKSNLIFSKQGMWAESSRKESRVFIPQREKLSNVENRARKRNVFS